MGSINMNAAKTKKKTRIRFIYHDDAFLFVLYLFFTLQRRFLFRAESRFEQHAQTYGSEKVDDGKGVE